MLGSMKIRHSEVCAAGPAVTAADARRGGTRDDKARL